MVDFPSIDTTFLQELDQFSDFDFQFATFICKLAKRPSLELYISALLSAQTSLQGNICFTLSENHNTILSSILMHYSQTCAPLEQWPQLLYESEVVGKPQDFRPLILKQSRLYLHKYWLYEWQIAKKINQLSLSPSSRIPNDYLGKKINSLFPSPQQDQLRMAAYIAATKKLCIITGGPGTGKTTTLAKIIALLSLLHTDSLFKIALAAPTGKAAKRIDETISQSLDQGLPGQTIKKESIDSATTIHRLLGATAVKSQFTFNESQPLPYDCIVVDEASMIDLTLMRNLLVTLDKKTTLILLGDKDQLASVHAGSLFGDLCNPTVVDHFSEPLLASINKADIKMNTQSWKTPKETLLPLADCIVELKHSYRFTGILKPLIHAVKKGEQKALHDLLEKSGDRKSCFSIISKPSQLEDTLSEGILKYFAPYLTAQSIDEMFQALSQFRILCALRKGPFGVIAINRLVESILAKNGLLSIDSDWYSKRPIIITNNSYSLKLYNGDIGIIAPDPAAKGALRAWFPTDASDSKTLYRCFTPSRLPHHETAFALTVHKCQGTEYNFVHVLLPDSDAPILTRELLYTAITRARKGIHLYGTPTILNACLKRTIDRTSGLFDTLKDFTVSPVDPNL